MNVDTARLHQTSEIDQTQCVPLMNGWYKWLGLRRPASDYGLRKYAPTTFVNNFDHGLTIPCWPATSRVEPRRGFLTDGHVIELVRCSRALAGDGSVRVRKDH